MTDTNLLVAQLRDDIVSFLHAASPEWLAIAGQALSHADDVPYVEHQADVLLPLVLAVVGSDRQALAAEVNAHRVHTEDGAAAHELGGLVHLLHRSADALVRWSSTVYEQPGSAPRRAAGSTTPSIMCPQCRRVSRDPGHVADGYCGNCHARTSPPLTQAPTGTVYLVAGWRPGRYSTIVSAGSRPDQQWGATCDGGEVFRAGTVHEARMLLRTHRCGPPLAAGMMAEPIDRADMLRELGFGRRGQ